MNLLARIAAASRRTMDGFVIFGMLAATALVILVIAVVIGAISKRAQRNGGQPARSASTSTAVPGQDVSAGGRYL
jgi:hypothetical protein